jgi:hypothetical protein
MNIRNVHERRVPGPIECVGAILDTLSSREDRLWPADRWPPMRLDGPLGVGAKGGHGPVRYGVVAYVPGRRVEFQFDSARGLMRGFEGIHRFEVSQEDGQVVIRHILEAQSGPAGAIRWFLMIGPLHDALIEDAFDRVELALTGTVARPARWGARVRLLRWLARRAARKRASD